MKTESQNSISRRQVLGFAARGMLLGMLTGSGLSQQFFNALADSPEKTQSDEDLLDEMERASFDFFWNETNPETGQIKDRALAHGGGHERMSSIAATGFGLSALCIADHRGWRKSPEIRDRVRKTLRFVWNTLPQVHGFFYHFVDMNTGTRWEKCELSCRFGDTGPGLGGSFHFLLRRVRTRWGEHALAIWLWFARDRIELFARVAAS